MFSSGFTINDDSFNDFGRCQGLTADDVVSMDPFFATVETLSLDPVISYDTTNEEIEELFPSIVDTPLWMGKQSKSTFHKWWHLVRQLPDYALVPSTVKELATTIVDVYARKDAAMMGLLRVIDKAVTSPTEALHYPLVYMKVASVMKLKLDTEGRIDYNAPKPRLPKGYLVAVAKTLALRVTLSQFPEAYRHIHWAEKQLPTMDRVFIVPHGDNTEEPEPQEKQTIVDAVSSATQQYTSTLWKLMDVLNDYTYNMPQNVNMSIDNVKKLDVFSKMLEYNILCEEDTNKLKDAIGNITKAKESALEAARLAWLDNLL